MPADSGEAGGGANIGTISGSLRASLDSRKICRVESDKGAGQGRVEAGDGPSPRHLKITVENSAQFLCAAQQLSESQFKK
jgi:hypothetical protein